MPVLQLSLLNWWTNSMLKWLLKKNSLEASGDSIMGLLMLGASKGSEIDLVLSGKQSEDTLSALSNLVENLFGEEM